MIITKIQGGLGNQLFQYAAGRSLAIKNNTDLKLDTSSYQNSHDRKYLLDNFNIEAKIADQKDIIHYKNNWWSILKRYCSSRYKIISNNNYLFNDRFFGAGTNTYLDGYWQSENYFKNIKSIIQKELTIRKIDKNLLDLMKQYSKSVLISLHVRCGDYLNPKFSRIYNHLDQNYYSSAISFISHRVEKPIYFIFSDDTNWVKNNLCLPNTSIFASEYGFEDYQELFLMSVCKHNIIANSSFSWWGAWLNKNPQKIVIAPKNWFITPLKKTSIIAENWHCL